jgi:hypothetical protein
MKKLFILILLLLFTISSVPAQKERIRTLVVNSGISVPYSDFANKTMVIDAGFAGVGMNIGVDYLSSKDRFLGFCASAGWSNINFNKKAYKSEYERVLNDNGEITVIAGNYNFFKTVVGLTAKIPEFHSIKILFIAQVGGSFDIHPELKVDHSRYGIINSIPQDNDWALIGNLGMKVNYKISDKYGVSLGYCLNSLRPAFNSNSSLVGNFFMPVRFQNINLGFIFKL